MWREVYSAVFKTHMVSFPASGYIGKQVLFWDPCLQEYGREWLAVHCDVRDSLPWSLPASKRSQVDDVMKG